MPVPSMLLTVKVNVPLPAVLAEKISAIPLLSVVTVSVLDEPPDQVPVTDAPETGKPSTFKTVTDAIACTRFFP